MSNHNMLPTPQSMPSAAPYNENAMAPYVDRKAHIPTDPATRAYVLRRTPDEIFGAVLGALHPKYQIDDIHQFALCNIIAQSFECVKDIPGSGQSTSAPIAVLKPPPQVQTTHQRYQGYHSSRKSTSAIINHYIRSKNASSNKPRGGFGAPKSVNGAFYMHHTDAAFKKTYPHAEVSQYEKALTPQGSGPYRRASVDMSPSKARKDRMDRAKLQKRAASFSLASTMPQIVISDEGDASHGHAPMSGNGVDAQGAAEIKKEDETDVDNKAADNTAHPVDVAELGVTREHSVSVEIKIEDDSGIDMEDIPMDPTKSFHKVEHLDNASVSQSLIKKRVSDNVSVTHGSTMNITQSFYQADDSDSESESDINDTQDSTEKDAIFTQPGGSTSETQITDATEPPAPIDTDKATEIKKSGPVRLKLNLPKPRRSSRIAKQASSSASKSVTSSLSTSPAPSVASSLGKRSRREGDEKGEPSKRSKMI